MRNTKNSPWIQRMTEIEIVTVPVSRWLSPLLRFFFGSFFFLSHCTYFHVYTHISRQTHTHTHMFVFLHATPILTFFTQCFGGTSVFSSHLACGRLLLLADATKRRAHKERERERKREERERERETRGGAQWMEPSPDLLLQQACELPRMRAARA